MYVLGMLMHVPMQPKEAFGQCHTIDKLVIKVRHTSCPKLLLSHREPLTLERATELDQFTRECRIAPSRMANGPISVNWEHDLLKLLALLLLLLKHPSPNKKTRGGAANSFFMTHKIASSPCKYLLLMSIIKIYIYIYIKRRAWWCATFFGFWETWPSHRGQLCHTSSRCSSCYTDKRYHWP